MMFSSERGRLGPENKISQKIGLGSEPSFPGISVLDLISASCSPFFVNANSGLGTSTKEFCEKILRAKGDVRVFPDQRLPLLP